ncbi:hypothetical protein ACIGMX_01530 [Streptomyces aquilus]|uniref:Uncharacterized protein n=1 Tax=Streptomyces aquilus TaxID=2548456 RepID=A0A3Q9C4N5_9ACTN|nr:hypothetical protein [Streptomyces aquilus]AZP21813.1 hypothetical protein EJC51_40480 [Streptomyces aquilus]
MGASGWDYVTPFKGTVEESLKALHAQVFQEEYGDDDTYGSIEELWEDEEFMGEEGTHTILDIDRVVHTTAAPSDRDAQDYGTLRPLAPDRVRHHFGTEHPTPAQFRAALTRDYAALGQGPGPAGTLLDECRMRWTGLYVVLHTGAEPTHLGIFGFSGD